MARAPPTDHKHQGRTQTNMAVHLVMVYLGLAAQTPLLPLVLSIAETPN